MDLKIIRQKNMDSKLGFFLKNKNDGFVRLNNCETD